MSKHHQFYISLRSPLDISATFLFCLVIVVACRDKSNKEDDVADSPLQLQEQTATLLESYLGSASAKDGSFEGAKSRLFYPQIMKKKYKEGNHVRLWGVVSEWSNEADSLLAFIRSSKLFGLFPEDYHINELTELRKKIIADSINRTTRKSPAFWAATELLLTDAFIGLAKDIKLGRLPNDSITLRKDSTMPDEFYWTQLDGVKQYGVSAVMTSLEPKHKAYQQLKAGIRQFLENADQKIYSKVAYPEKNIAKLNRSLQKRLFEEGFLASDSVLADSIQLAKAIREYQQKKGITADGRAGEATIRTMNVNDQERFIRIAISLDKYKMLPAEMPMKYIWVNVSANYLALIESDTVRLLSKVICGKPKTRTPVLTSDITQLVTYPQWVPPPSIVLREILPAVKKNPGYLAKKGFSLLDSKGNEVDPYSVDWSKYSKGIPYRIVQGSGDANALGIMKFVFANKYSVYLHDTNQRYLFANSMRSLSHGCVRVQDWEKLAFYILRNDSLNAKNGGYTKSDSVRYWLGNKQKKTIAVRNKIPVFLRYITCEGKNGSITFYDDVYAEDKLLREKHFAAK